jgi:hypothetical protein
VYRNLILNTYTDITTTATQKLDLKYIHSYITTTAMQKLDLKYIHRYNSHGNAET